MLAARPRWVVLGSLVLLTALALGLWSHFTPRTGADAGRGPIVIGMLHALSGPSAKTDAPLLAAARLAVEEINAGGGLLGRLVELKVEDSRADPRVAAAAAERLIATDHAVALFGCGSSSCRLAVKPVVEARRHLLFYPLAYEGMEQSPHIVYTGPTPNQQALPATDWAMRSFGQRVYLVGTDGVYPRHLGVVLRDFVKLGGGQVLGERYVAPGGDFSEVAADLNRLQPDVVLSSVSGDHNRAFFDALVAAGLNRLPLLSYAAAEPEMKAFDGGRLDRHFTAWGYLQSQPGPANEAFLTRLRHSQGEGVEASDAAVASYVSVHLWAAAAREVRSPQTEAVNANVPHQTVASPQGFAALDSQTRHLWRQLRIAQVKPGGQLAEVLLMPRFIRPEPWPTFRSTEHWAQAIATSEVKR